jgi:NTE family protein
LASTPIALVLGGGNALGAYQAGAYEAIVDASLEPDLMAGASIGAVNAAIIAGNARSARLQKLEAFWAFAAQFPKQGAASFELWPRERRDLAVMQTLLTGRPGLFSPRLGELWGSALGVMKANSLFDTSMLPKTLASFIDFRLLSASRPRLLVCAVDVETGDEVVFDSTLEAIGPDHIRASAAFLPLYPPVDVGGRLLCDPGVSANLPLAALLEAHHTANPEMDLLCIAIDLVSPRGKRPRTLGDSIKRSLDLMLAGQARHALETLALKVEVQSLRHQISTAGAGRKSPPLEPNLGRVTLLHVVFEEREAESPGKMLDYSGSSLGERWEAGRLQMRDALRQLPPIGKETVPLRIFRYSQDRLQPVPLGTGGA